MKQTSLFTFAETEGGFTPAAAAVPRPVAATAPVVVPAPVKRRTSEASWSPCKKYCYTFLRRWDTPGSSRVLFIGLFPSLAADDERDDATLRHEVLYAREWGFGGVYRVNLYGWRTIAAQGLRAAPNPVEHLHGYHNRLLALRAQRCELVVADWGPINSIASERALAVLRLLDRPVHCLGTSADGSPLSPVRLTRERKPELFWTPEAGELNHEDTKGTK